MTSIVTGATGFIGRHLVDALAASGEDVRCITRGKAGVDSRPNITVHQGDFERADLGVRDAVMDGADVVYHLGGATRAVSAAAFTAANIDVTRRLLDRIGTGQAPRFVYVSSQAASGPASDADHPKTEADPEAPIEDYGRSKLAAERLVSANTRVPWTVVRPVAVYGPGDRDFLSIFAMAKRGVAIYPGIRHASVNTIFVGDLVTGIIAAARSSTAERRTYFLGDDTAQSWKEIYATIATIVGNPGPLEMSVPRAVVTLGGVIGDMVGIATGRPSLVNRNKAILAAPKYWLCSSGRARRDIGFQTPTALRDGLRATYDWYVQHKWL